MKSPISVFSLVFLFLLSFTCVNASVRDHSTTRKKVPEKYLISFGTEYSKNHPEYGILPYNTPCEDCIELLEKRAYNSREFVGIDKGAKVTWSQKSVGSINYQDENGYWISVDPLLKQVQADVFTSTSQPSPVTVNLRDKWTSVTNAGKEFIFNRNIALFHVSLSGEVHSFGKQDWSNIIKYDENSASRFLVKNIYDGIDLEFVTFMGRVKSNFILNKKIQFTDGYLALSQEIEIPSGLKADFSSAIASDNSRYSGTLLITDKVGENYFHFSPAHAFDSKTERENYVEMPFSLVDGLLIHYVPLNWLRSPSIQYPVTIDPLVSSTNTIALGSIAGSGFVAVCGVGGCNYVMPTFQTPANCTITAINSDFGYVAKLPCSKPDGGFTITLTTNLGACSSVPQFCPGGGIGLCFFQPSLLLSSFPACVRPPQCAPYDVDFNMLLYRCNFLNQAGCDSTCIAAIIPWTMTVEGRTVELTSVSLPTPICEGSNTNMAATAIFGVPPYTFQWDPGALIGNPVNVSPTATTTYTVTVIDVCGITDTGTTSLTVVPNQNPGFVITPNDTVCTGTPMTFTGNGSGAASSYDWIISCPGNTNINNVQAANFTPATAGNCSVSLIFSTTLGTLTCTDTVTQNFLVNPGSPPTVSITSSPPGSVCPGQAILFTAIPVNGGAAPTFQWFFNGSPVGGNFDTLNLTAPATNFSVSVLINSSSPCANPDTVSTTIQVTVTGAVAPSVTVTAAPSTVCNGQPITFTANPVNGGSAPTYQWQLNGTNIPGATNATFTTSTLVATDVISVNMTSNLNCAFPTTASANGAFTITNNLVPGVTVNTAPAAACSGQPITFTANPVNGGTAPTYQWQLNGSNIPGATNVTFTSTTLTSTDVVSVIMTSNDPCANPLTAAVNGVFAIVNNLVPAVTVNTAPAQACSTQPITFTANPVNGGGAPTYQWQLNGSNIPGATNATFTTTTLTSTDVINVIMTSNDPCANPLTAIGNGVFAIVNNLVPAVTVNAAPGTTCSGQPITFTANPVNGGAGPTYQWQLNGVNIPGATNITFTSSTLVATDVVSVNMTSNDPCANPLTATGPGAFTITPNVVPAVNITSIPGTSICSGTPVTFTANPNNGGTTPAFQWTLSGTPIPGATQSTYSPPAISNGNIFGVVLTSSSSCAVPANAGDTILMTVITPTVPTISMTSSEDTICSGESVSFNSSITGGGPNPVFQWTINGSPVGLDTNVFSSVTLNEGDVIAVTMTSSLTCVLPQQVTDNFIIHVNPTLVPSISITSDPPSVCDGGLISFAATTVNEGTAPDYQWTVNGNPVGTNSTTFSSSALNNGDVIEISLTSNATCVSPSNVNSNQITAVIMPMLTPSVTITQSDDTICTGNSVTFTAAGLNGGPTPVFDWFVNGLPQSATGATFSTNTLAQGDLINVVLNSSELCLTQASANSNILTISIHPPLSVFTTGATAVCPYTPVPLAAVPGGGDGGPYSYSWTNGAGTDSLVIVAPAITTTYAVTITDPCGSLPVEDSVTVTVFPAPDPGFGYEPDEPSTFNPDVDFIDLSNQAITWFWQFGDGDSSFIQNPEHTYASPGVYEVELVVTNAEGCIDSITYLVIVKEDISVFIPNSFTPNGDGRNEFFTPIGVSLEDFSFIIFDRWGSEVFRGGPLKPWNGMSKKGDMVPQGVYTYRVDLKLDKFDKRIVTGRVTLIY